MSGHRDHVVNEICHLISMTAWDIAFSSSIMTIHDARSRSRALGDEGRSMYTLDTRFGEASIY